MTGGGEGHECKTAENTDVVKEWRLEKLFQVQAKRFKMSSVQ